MNDSYDCVIVGGGPAGSTAAAIVAEAGFTTLLAEREAMPRFHVGESLMPETYWTLDRLGLLDKLRESTFVKKVGVQFVNPTGSESQPFFFDRHDPRDCSQTWHVERADFDQILFENAAAKGADCRDSTRVVDIQLGEQIPHEIRLRDAAGEETTVKARVLIDATGQQALLANRLKLRMPNPRLRKAAIWGHFRGARRSEDGAEVTTILHAEGKKSWFWYIPLSDNKVSVGLVADTGYLLKRSEPKQDIFSGEVSRCPGVEDRLAGAELIDRLHVDREFSYTTSRHAGDGWVLVGDALGFIDPVYSTGVLLALKSGELAADAAVEGLKKGDLSERQLGAWTGDFMRAIERFRALVHAFYTPEFSFASFVKRNPSHRPRLTDLLIGRGFNDATDSMLADLGESLSDSGNA